MKVSLYRKFLTVYILTGVLSFLLIVLAGSYMIERYLERTLSRDLYREANNIAASDTVRNGVSSSNLETLRASLSAVAQYQDSVIWISNSEGDIILSTRRDIEPESPINVENFDPVAWGSNYYQIGDFYGYFPEKRLSVIAPITENMTIRGYVSIHYLMRDLYERRGSALTILLILFAILYGMSILLLFLYRKKIHLPMRQVTRGAAEFANGNLSYRIPVSSDDEMGYLANTLNYMAEKMNNTGEYQRNFVSNVSHDFRSPLTSIKGYVNAMLDGTIPTEMQEKYLKIISYEAERLEKLTNSLLVLNELNIQNRLLHFERFDINDIIKTTAATFEGICTARKIRLELILSGRELYAWADMEQIEQVLYNLLDNAIKFSFDNSSINVETTEKNDRIFVSVKDHGTGIPRESLPKIWDRFYKTDASRGKDREGTGLGLSIVREIIRAHGENIDVISTEGIGTEFIFTLSKAKEQN